MLQILIWIAAAALGFAGYKEVAGLRSTRGVFQDLLKLAASVTMFAIAAFCVVAANHLAATTSEPIVSAADAFGHEYQGGDLNKAASDAIADVNAAAADADVTASGADQN